MPLSHYHGNVTLVVEPAFSGLNDRTLSSSNENVTFSDDIGMLLFNGKFPEVKFHKINHINSTIILIIY